MFVPRVCSLCIQMLKMGVEINCTQNCQPYKQQNVGVSSLNASLLAMCNHLFPLFSGPEWKLIVLENSPLKMLT